jgi:hypothetical protein
MIKVSKSIYIHIGTHKTGSTSIQVFLRQHAEELKNSNIIVPVAGTKSNLSGHHNIAWELRNDVRFNPSNGTLKDLLTEIRFREDCKVVISSEDFEYLSQYPKELKNFDRTLEHAGFKVKYLVFFRDIESYSESLYHELKKHNVYISKNKFDQIVKNFGFFKCNRDWYFEFNYKRFVETWESIVEKKIISMDYNVNSKEIGILPAFLEQIGADSDLIKASLSAKKNNIRR